MSRGEEGTRMTGRIEPVRVGVTVERGIEEAFRLFTEGIGDWWPLATHAIDEERAETAVFEPRVGGRIYERHADGGEADWGTALVWEPPARVVFTWKPNLEQREPTEVEVRFTADGDATRLELEHRGWEALGEHALRARRDYETGWPGVLARYRAAT